MTTRKVLVDTSAWILGFRRTGPEKLKNLLMDLLDQDRVVISPIIAIELLQGCRTQGEFDALKSRMEALENRSLEDLNWDKAFQLAFDLRKRGLTIPTLDILIAFLCIENGYALLHHDRHFRLIAESADLSAIDFLDEGKPFRQTAD